MQFSHIVVPLSLIRMYKMKLSAWYAVHIQNFEYCPGTS